MPIDFSAGGPGYAQYALLPEGVRDELAPSAEFEADVINRLLSVFAGYGYDRVSPPLVEYEDSLLSGVGATKSSEMFRLMDAATQRTMAVRSDMTQQIARIAATRLQNEERPLRLSYAGQVLRTKGSEIRPTREFWQAGVEFLGVESIEAEAEVILLAVESLSSVGVENLTLDLTIAPLVPMLASQLGLDSKSTNLVRSALDSKDIAALSYLPHEERGIFETILGAADEAHSAMAKLQALKLEGDAGVLVEHLCQLVIILNARSSGLSITVDPAESRGFEYKSGIGFAIFARGVRGELGRGGRYNSELFDGSVESATGFSVYLDSILRALPAPKRADKLFLPYATESALASSYRKKGWRTVQGLTDSTHPIDEARRLNCSHCYNGSEIISCD